MIRKRRHHQRQPSRRSAENQPQDHFSISEMNRAFAQEEGYKIRRVKSANTMQLDKA